MINEESIRTGQHVAALDQHWDKAVGKIESGHAGQWMIRTTEGELTGPWDTEDLYPHLYVITVNMPGYLPQSDDVEVFTSIAEAWEELAQGRERDTESAEECPHGDCAEAPRVMRAQTQCGTVHAHTCGYEGDHDLGLCYSVDVWTG